MAATRRNSAASGSKSKSSRRGSHDSDSRKSRTSSSSSHNNNNHWQKATQTDSHFSQLVTTTKSGNQQQQKQQQPRSLWKGGGYCSHVYKSYDERWSEGSVNHVVRSWGMTPRQKDKLLQLQNRIEDVDHYLNEPNQLVYFLKDELGNVEMAEVSFRKVVQSRQTVLLSSSLSDHSSSPPPPPPSMDTLLTTYTLPDDYDYFPMAVLEGTDLQGDPIHVIRTGAADCWELYRRHGRETMIHHAVYNQELNCRGAWVDDYEAKYQKRVTQFTVIFDLQGLGARHMRPGLLPVCGSVARILQGTRSYITTRLLLPLLLSGIDYELNRPFFFT